MTNRPLPFGKRVALSGVFAWFLIGGIGHFTVPEFFLKIVPPALPLRIEAVYLSGAFELLGALGLLHRRSRRAAGIGLILLTVAVTPANFYMWLHPELFPRIPAPLLGWRLVLQVALIACIWWATRPHRTAPATRPPVQP